MADQRTDYYRAVNALDLVDWLAALTEDKVTLAKYAERIERTLEAVQARLKDGNQA